MHRRGGSDTSRVERAVRGDVVDLAARNADVIEFEVIEVGQIGAQPLACAPFLKRSPISPQEAEDATLRAGLAFQSDYAVGRVHCLSPENSVSTRPRVPRHERACLTYGLHFPHRRLILCVATDARASTIGGPREWQLALSLRGVRNRHRPARAASRGA